MSKEENMEYLRFTISETINRCEDERALEFIYHFIKCIKPKLRQRNRAELETLSRYYEVEIEEVSKTGSLI